MTDTQIYALIALSISVCALASMSYWMGRSDGYNKGVIDGQTLVGRESQAELEGLQALLDKSRFDQKRLRTITNWALAKSSLGEKEHLILLEIADHLQLSSDTFAALTSKSQAQRSLQLRTKALGLAERLRPAVREAAA